MTRCPLFGNCQIIGGFDGNCLWTRFEALLPNIFTCRKPNNLCGQEFGSALILNSGAVTTVQPLILSFVQDLDKT